MRVWAPRARQVAVVLGEERRALAAEGGGWWALGEALPPDTDYAFLLDGEGPFPDPRSRRQPHGVHGASRTVDPRAFRWTDAHFRAPPLASALIYELHVGTFSPEGTFDGVIGRLDHLVDLGVTHVELMPVSSFPGARGWGYDGVQLGAVHEAYGGPAGLARLVDACHARGLAVILDVVYNHFGPDGNYLPRFGPYLTDAHRTPWGDAVNLEQAGAHEVRRFLIDDALGWLRDLHVDALRLDAVHAFVDRSAIHLLEELAGAVAALAAEVGRPLALIAESDLNDPRVVTPREAGGLGLDAQWSDDFHHAVHAWLTGERDGYYADFGPVEAVAEALREGFVHAGRYAPFRDRVHGRPLGGLSGHRLLGYTQNHDQIGNRATGERLGHLVSDGRARLAVALTLLSPFVPMLFMGEEWGASTPFLYFTDHGDPALARAVSEGRRREFAAFGWRPEDVPDPQDPATFEASRLRWEELAEPRHAGMLEWTRALVRLRRAWPELTDGRRERVEVDHDPAGWLRVRRGRVTLVGHLGGAPAEVEAVGRVVLATDGVVDGGGRVRLPPDGVAVLVAADLAGGPGSG